MILLRGGACQRSNPAKTPLSARSSRSVRDARVGRELEEHGAIEIAEKRVVHPSMLADGHHVAAYIVIVELMAADMCSTGILHQLG